MQYAPKPPTFHKELRNLCSSDGTSAQPSQRSFYYPSFGQHFELMTSSRTFDDFQQPAGVGLDPVNQLPSVSRVGPDQLEPRGSPDQPVQDQFGSMPILDISGLDYDSQQHSHGVYDDMPFASRHLLARIIAARPPFPVVFTDWLSMMAALGVGCLPSACRTLGRSISGTRSRCRLVSTFGSTTTPSLKAVGRAVMHAMCTRSAEPTRCR